MSPSRSTASPPHSGQMPTGADSSSGHAGGGGGHVLPGQVPPTDTAHVTGAGHHLGRIFGVPPTRGLQRLRIDHQMASATAFRVAELHRTGRFHQGGHDVSPPISKTRRPVVFAVFTGLVRFWRVDGFPTAKVAFAPLS